VVAPFGPKDHSIRFRNGWIVSQPADSVKVQLEAATQRADASDVVQNAHEAQLVTLRAEVGSLTLAVLQPIYVLSSGGAGICHVSVGGLVLIGRSFNGRCAVGGDGAKNHDPSTRRT
jgi:hypothetical protein